LHIFLKKKPDLNKYCHHIFHWISPPSPNLLAFTRTMAHTNDMKGPLVGGFEGSACQ
jgi:hypothetical protein